MVVRTRLRAGKREARRLLWRMLGQVVKRALHFEQKLIGHFSREAMANKNALDDKIFAIGRHGVRRDQPPALAQSIGEVVERKTRRCGVFQFPTEAGDPTVAVINNLEVFELRDFLGEIASQCIALALHLAVALLTKAEKVVVLAYDLPARPREVK